MLIEHGADIHEVCDEIGTYPMVISSALSDYRFFEKVLKLGLDPLSLFACEFGNGMYRNRNFC